MTYVISKSEGKAPKEKRKKKKRKTPSKLQKGFGLLAESLEMFEQKKEEEGGAALSLPVFRWLKKKTQSSPTLSKMGNSNKVKVTVAWTLLYYAEHGF